MQIKEKLMPSITPPFESVADRCGGDIAPQYEEHGSRSAPPSRSKKKIMTASSRHSRPVTPKPPRPKWKNASWPLPPSSTRPGPQLSPRILAPGNSSPLKPCGPVAINSAVESSRDGGIASTERGSERQPIPGPRALPVLTPPALRPAIHARAPFPLSRDRQRRFLLMRNER